MAATTLVNGEVMPLVGLGTWKASPDEVGDSVRTALLNGYRHIDCAAAYANESAVGKALKDVFDSGKVRRADIFIVSKLANARHHPDDVAPALNTTLADLQLEYLDLYLMHWPLAFQPGPAGFGKIREGITILDTWRAMEALVDAGKVKTLGVANYTVDHLRELLPHCRIRPAVNQVELHPYLPQRELVDFCRKEGIHVTAYSSLGSGGTPSLLEDAVVTEVAKELKRTPGQVLLRWGVQHGHSVIPKSVRPERVLENGALDFELPPTALARLDGITTRRRFVDPRKIFGLDVFGEGPLAS